MAEMAGVEGVIVKPKRKARDAERCRELTKMEKRLLAPAGCRAYLRRSLAKEFPGIVDGFVKAAKSGSIHHVKLVAELMQPTRRGTTRIKGPAARFFQKLEQEKKERARLKAEKLAGADVCVNR
jgi:hypothetical protein